jgi:integrase
LTRQQSNYSLPEAELFTIFPPGRVSVASECAPRILSSFYRCSPKERSYLEAVHHYKDAQRDPKRAGERLWTWSRTTAWRRVKAVMLSASVPHHISTPRSVRHAFGAKAVMKNVNLAMIKRWLGHRRIETTTIYTTVIGPEERALARRMRVGVW